MKLFDRSRKKIGHEEKRLLADIQASVQRRQARTTSEADLSDLIADGDREVGWKEWPAGTFRSQR